MYKIYFLLLTLFFLQNISAQELYFPPTTGNDWVTLDPMELNWCDEKINNLYGFLEEKNTRAFLILKDGKIVLEKYFNGHGPDSLWYWASAGKTVTATLVGIAQEEGLLNIEDPTSDYLGDGWTSAPQEKEDLITLRHQLTMTSGLDDATNNDCTDHECLTYVADAGTRWAYHNGSYTNLSYVVENATGQNYNAFYFNRLAQKIGMGGLWVKLGYNRILFSKARSMARFGLLMQNDGYWDATPVLTDINYINAMRNTSQDLNKSYGYLWWLNGKESYRLPSLQWEFPGPLSEEAPMDSYSAMGKNGQILSIVPSQGLVMVRMGDSPDNSPVPLVFFNELWEKINDLNCNVNAASENEIIKLEVYPNPVYDVLNFSVPENWDEFEIAVFNSIGERVYFLEKDFNGNSINVGKLNAGVYFLQLISDKGEMIERFVSM